MKYQVVCLLMLLRIISASEPPELFVDIVNDQGALIFRVDGESYGTARDFWSHYLNARKYNVARIEKFDGLDDDKVGIWIALSFPKYYVGGAIRLNDIERIMAAKGGKEMVKEYGSIVDVFYKDKDPTNVELGLYLDAVSGLLERYKYAVKYRWK